MDEEILDLICCPNCQGDLMYEKIGDEKEEIFEVLEKKYRAEEKLICKTCKKEFLIKDNIPILL